MQVMMYTDVRMSREAGCRERLSDGVRQVGQLGTRRRLHPAKPHVRSIRAIDVDPIEKKHVKMDVHRQPH